MIVEKFKGDPIEDQGKIPFFHTNILLRQMKKPKDQGHKDRIQNERHCSSGLTGIPDPPGCSDIVDEKGDKSMYEDLPSAIVL